MMRSTRATVYVATFLISLTAHAVAAQEKPKNIVYYNPAWSPDGKTIVFETNRATPKTAIYTIRADGGGLTRLTPGDADETQATFSRDGKRIVFSSARAGSLDLYTMNVDGSGITRVTNTPRGGGYYQATFSPDGKRIAFQGRADNARVDDHIYVVQRDGTGWRQLTDSTTTSMSPRWTRDGQWIVFDAHPVTKWFWKELQRGDLKPMQDLQAVYAIRPDGSGLRRYTEKMPSGDISPDGKWRATTESADKVPGLYLLEIGTGNARKLTGGVP